MRVAVYAVIAGFFLLGLNPSCTYIASLVDREGGNHNYEQHQEDFSTSRFQNW